MAPNVLNSFVEQRRPSGNVPVGKEDLKMTMGQFSKMCEREENNAKCMFVIMGKIYDVTSWLDRHPGGPLLLQALNGKDATSHFYTSHTPQIALQLSRFCVGEISDFKLTPLQKDFLAIRDQLQKEGLFEPNLSWYFKRFVALGVLFVISIALTLMAKSLITYMVAAFLLGLFWQQASFLGHDFGHNAVFKKRWQNQVAGLVATCLFGVGGGWWKRVHNVHHVVTNSQEGDPDIQYLPLFAVGEKACKDYYSFFHKRTFKFDSAAKFLVSYQHLLYLPILFIARVNLYAQSAMTVWNNNIPVENRTLEKLSQIFFFTWLSMLLMTIPDWQTRLIYALISHLVCGIVHLQIVQSHFAMDIYHGLGNDDGTNDFIRTQIGTTMNVDCHPWMDWFHGGLQFQVEHHLFPRLPRHNLRFVMTKYVRPLCEKYDIQYHALSFFGVNMRVYETMHRAAVFARKNAHLSLDESMIGKLLNSEG